MISKQKIWLNLGLVFLLGLLYLLKPILAPFLVGALLAYLGNPLVLKLQRLKLPRTIAVVTVFVLIILVTLLFVLLLIPMLQKQVQILIDKAPAIIDFAQTIILPWLGQQLSGLGINEYLDINHVKDLLVQNWQQAGSVAGVVWKTLSHSGAALFAWVVNILLIPVVTFYLLRDWPILLNNLEELLPRRQAPKVLEIVGECDEVLSAFFRGQLMVMIALGIIYSVGLSFVGLQLALLIGFIAGLLSIVPYLGFSIGLLSALIAAAIQFPGGLHLLYVLIVFIIGNVLEGMVLTPWLVGDKIGLHPVAVIFAILAGGQLFGFIGILIALPVAAVLMVLLRHLRQHYIAGNLYR